MERLFDEILVVLLFYFSSPNDAGATLLDRMKEETPTGLSLSSSIGSEKMDVVVIETLLYVTVY